MAPEGSVEFAVLRRRDEIDAAHRRLVERGLMPPAANGIARVAQRAGDAARRVTGAPHLRPDPIKSWDVELALRAIEAQLGFDDPVLDMGSVGCPILPALHSLGYHDLHGVDLDPNVRRMPDGAAIDYSVQDMTSTRFADDSFAAITSMSVIEHGLDADALLTEVARLLRPGGMFLFSTDYWPDKIDTSGVRLFDMSWTIFSADEIGALIDGAGARGLAAPVDLAAALHAVDERPIDFADRRYTFLFGALTCPAH
jgi:SAM-dependent methyltransferase